VHGFDVLSKEVITEIYGDPPMYMSLDFPTSDKSISKEEGAHIATFGIFRSFLVPLMC
jgi:hypothetical protein